MFEISAEKTRRRWTVPLAMLSELLVVAILASMPVMHVEVLPASVSRMISLVPPPPLPRAATGRQEPLKIVRKFDPAKLTSPTPAPTIPNEAVPAMPQAPEIAGVLGGVSGDAPGGVLGGIPGGGLGGILNSLSSPAPPPPPPPAAVTPSEPEPPSRIRVGGNVQAGLLLYGAMPLYPKLARLSHISGTVRLKAVIGCDGKIKDLTLISGHPLLNSAAEAAVRQWIYRPTLLNGLPAEVETEIDVNFIHL